MKQNHESITPLRKYIAIGYAVIALLIGGIVFIYLSEWRDLDRIEAESKEVNLLRQKVHDAYAQMLDLTLYGEKVLEWNAEDTLVYRGKRLAMDSILCEFKQHYPPERLDSLCNLLADKEQQLFHIWELFSRQEALNERLATEVPIIAHKSTQEPSKKKGGFLGLTLNVEVGYIEVKHRSQSMTHHLLTATITCHLTVQEFTYNINLTL